MTACACDPSCPYSRGHSHCTGAALDSKGDVPSNPCQTSKGQIFSRKKQWFFHVNTKVLNCHQRWKEAGLVSSRTGHRRAAWCSVNHKSSLEVGVIKRKLNNLKVKKCPSPLAESRRSGAQGFRPSPTWGTQLSCT